MCELMTVAGDRSFALGPILDWARRLETLGFAGYGWGVAWVTAAGLDHYKRPSSLAEDVEGAQNLAKTQVLRALIHLRRPTDPTTISDADTQPFVDEARSFAFAHNGFFKRHNAFRGEFADELQGRGDTEVAFRMLARKLREGTPASEALVGIHEQLTGTANCGYLGAAGELLVYHANSSNPCWTLTHEGLRVMVTGLHWRDRSGLDVLFPGSGAATRIQRGVTELATAVALVH
jgi:predicted glutamine amidotransferase